MVKAIDASDIVGGWRDSVEASRPDGLNPSDAILQKAIELYSQGHLHKRQLRQAVILLETQLKADHPDLLFDRASRSNSRLAKPAGLSVCEPRVSLQSRRDASFF